MDVRTILLVSIYFFILQIYAFDSYYEYYTSDSISSGLSADQPYLMLNGKNFSILGGAMHYFRVPRAYWRDRLRKIRAAGLNTVQTFIPWNLHEPQSGVYDFGNGGSEMEDFLHLEEFLKTAQEEDLFVVVRIGPYICSEYNFGGFPAWLLREKEIGFRTTEPTYLKYVERYFNILLAILKDYQFTKGGPAIAFQVENEYGQTAGSGYTPELGYLEKLRQIMVNNGIVELLVTADEILKTGVTGTIPGTFLQTAHFGSNPEGNLNKLRELQPDRPIMAMAFPIGRYDYWSGNHHTESNDTGADLYERILSFPASVTIYMFHGGTNFGFLNGAEMDNSLPDNSGYKPIITSYDYDSPLDEAGDYTDKYFMVRETLGRGSFDVTPTPKPTPPQPRIQAYSSVRVQSQLPFTDILRDNAPYVIETENVIAMEMLDINNGSGQSVGYIVYRKENVDLAANTVLKIEGHICDTAFVLVNGELVSPVLQSKDDLDKFGYWRLENSTVELNTQATENATVDIVVEQWGRMNRGTINQYNQTFKGLWQGDVYLNDDKVSGWKIIPLEFKKSWTNNLKGWSEKSSNNMPGLYHANLEISGKPADTFIDMRKWTKGLVIVNGFPLGKYAKIGPQQALYLPAPFLKTGSNDIVILEHFKADDELSFVTKQIWTTV